MGETTNNESAPKESRYAGLKAEFNKIVWPDKDSVTKQTTAVVIASVILGLIIALIDYIIQYGVDFLKIVMEAKVILWQRHTGM